MSHNEICKLFLSLHISFYIYRHGTEYVSFAMLDLNVIVTIVPAILTAIFAYLVAHKRNVISERISKAKVDADVQSQALNIVSDVMNDLKKDLHKEIDSLKTENAKLKEEVEENSKRLNTLQQQLVASDLLVASLKSEISILKKTLSIYEDEIARLRKEA